MEKPLTKIVQYFPAQSLGKQTIEFVDNKLISNWKNLFSSYQRKIDLKDMSPNYDTGKGAFDNWGGFAWFFFVIAVVWALLHMGLVFILVPLFIAFLFFILRFKKYDWVYFWDTQHVNSISIRYSGNILAKKNFVENLVDEIKLTQKTKNNL
jgi:hypothetical protein